MTIKIDKIRPLKQIPGFKNIKTDNLWNKTVLSVIGS